MLTDYTITDADVGMVLTPEDGYLVNLVKTQPGIFDGAPQWDYARCVWKTGYFVLRGQYDIRNLFSIDLAQALAGGVWVTNNNLGFRGGLVVVCVPRGSI